MFIDRSLTIYFKHYKVKEDKEDREDRLNSTSDQTNPHWARFFQDLYKLKFFL